MNTNQPMETVSVHVSGDCPNCGITNNATLNKQIPTGHRGVSLVVASATCGNGDCRAIAQLSGHA